MTETYDFEPEDRYLVDDTPGEGDHYYPRDLEDEVSDDDFKGKCDLCDEPYDARSPLPSRNEVGEFVAPDGTHVIAHAQCGITSGYELA